jgi:hypothetical protein
MRLCKGFKDWFECLQCPYLCSKTCPIESDDPFEEMKKGTSNSPDSVISCDRDTFHFE